MTNIERGHPPFEVGTDSHGGEEGVHTNAALTSGLVSWRPVDGLIAFRLIISESTNGDEIVRVNSFMPATKWKVQRAHVGTSAVSSTSGRGWFDRAYNRNGAEP